MNLQLHRTAIQGVVILQPRVFRDARGFFLESYSDRDFRALGIQNHWVQDNHSRSQKGTLRGLHFQVEHPQAKLCRVTRGRVLDVAVDIRPESPTFGQHVAVELNDENGYMLLVPRGMAHGFLVLSDEVDFLYKCDEFYFPSDQGELRFDDPHLNIAWPLAELNMAPILSPKDEAAPSWSELFPSTR
ncbi:dTDP-4-dehydrorhamnose 3,5-epimerase [Abditibacteriota bacterium]|nr:dTDP-4-dehydrorhamnose 3,5-epimerase [Abditibacteriota bacterium]